MGVTVAINHPDFPQDYAFGIDHLGEIPNGGTLEVPEENERIFIAVRGMTVEDAFSGSEITTVSGSSDVDDAEDIIGDKRPPGHEQGVSPKPEQETQQSETPTSEEAPTEVTPPPTEEAVS